MPACIIILIQFNSFIGKKFTFDSIFSVICFTLEESKFPANKYSVLNVVNYFFINSQNPIIYYKLIILLSKVNFSNSFYYYYFKSKEYSLFVLRIFKYNKAS